MFIIFYSFAAFKFLPEKQMQAMNEYSILNILKTVVRQRKSKQQDSATGTHFRTSLADIGRSPATEYTQGIPITRRLKTTPAHREATRAYPICRKTVLKR